MHGRTLMCWAGVLTLSLLGASFGSACGGDSETAPIQDVTGDSALLDDVATPPTGEELLHGVSEIGAYELPGLLEPVEVVFTELGVPHIYGRNRVDVGRTLGFLLGRDRYFVMDLQRRLGLGRLTELLGDSTLEMDQEMRGMGMAYVADRILANLSPEMEEYLDAFAEGVNAYIAQVAAGDLPPPSELDAAYALLGADSPADLMHPWDRRSVAGMVSVVLYETTYEGGDVGRAAKAEALKSIFLGEGPNEGLRRAGFLEDVAYDHRALFEAHSSPGFGVSGTPAEVSGPDDRVPAPSEERGEGEGEAELPLPESLVLRLAERLERVELRLLRDDKKGFGSNAWAVSGSASATGASLVAGDGHLPLTVPPLMYQVGLDTELLGGGDIHQLGLLLTGLPVLAVGTNGSVAWSQVNPVTDTTDWYLEELQLSPEGEPASTLFQGEWKGLERIEETYSIADVALLDSAGRTEVWARWVTFDGRWIADVEGREAGPDEDLAEGEVLVNLQGTLVVPGDLDGDGVISAISFDYAALDATSYVDTLDALGLASSVSEYQDATRGIIGSGLFSAVGDQQGNILFTSYQGVPCRSYLPRDEDGRWVDGANPTLLLDGTTYGGFTLPMKDGHVDESDNDSDPYRCVVPFDETPQSINPAPGYVFSANNDPGHLTADGDAFNDAWYIGGPWSSVRAHTIARELEAAVQDGGATLDDMERIQGNQDSRLGEVFSPYLVEAIAYAREIPQDAPDAVDARVAALYAEHADSMEEVAARLQGWADTGFEAASGVETFYEQPTDGQLDAAVATMIFNAWLGRAMRGVWDDEPTGDVWLYSGDRMKIRAFRRFLDGRGADNPSALSSWDPATEESVFFDHYGTPEVESSEEILLQALAEALTFLSGPSEGAGSGGFATDDMSAWLWGLRHQVRFESLLAEFLGDDPAFGFLADLFSIDTDVLPLAESLPNGDPRKALRWFPRGGDQWCVDAANPGFSGSHFTHTNGPVMRMVIALKDGEVEGRNVLPGGQSALVDSPHFADQAALWLGNESSPMRFSPEQVLEGATGRERFTPAP